MSEAATPAVAAGNRVSTTRIVGGAGVAFAVSVVVQNAVLAGAGAPTYGAPLGEVLAYHAENRGVMVVAVGQEAVNLPLLLLFVTGLHGLVQRRGGAGADWSRLAVAAGATLSRDLRPPHCHAHRGRARRGWPGRADPRLRAGLAAPCRGLRARAARARGDLHRRGVGHPRQRFDAAVAAAARRGGRQLAASWPGSETSPSRMARHCCSSGLRASLRGSSGSLSPAYGSSVDRADVALWWRSLKRKKGGCNGSWSKGSRAWKAGSNHAGSYANAG